MKRINTFLFLTGFLALSTAAFAKKDKRDGFNFGTGIRLIGANDKINPTESSENTTVTKTSGQAFTPYVGYSFGALNLGLAGYIESSTQEVNEKNKDGTVEIKRSTESSTKGISIFGRFLFGKVMFFEVGGGYYAQNLSMDNEYKTNTANGFEGTSDSYSLNTSGLGTHFGGGLEIPIDDGFYFTGAYILRILQLRDMNSGSEFGTKHSVQEKRELTFGLAHYY